MSDPIDQQTSNVDEAPIRGRFHATNREHNDALADAMTRALEASSNEPGAVEDLLKLGIDEQTARLFAGRHHAGHTVGDIRNPDAPVETEPVSCSSSPSVSYYFWKWAANDLPGPPLEVYSALLRGEMHGAVQPFDARPLLGWLAKSAERGRSLGEEWEWRVYPPTTPTAARFVYVSCPRINGSRNRAERFSRDFRPLKLSGWDEEWGQLIPCLQPKTNAFILGQFPFERSYEVQPENLPDLLGRIVPEKREAWADLWNCRDHVKAIAEGAFFRVEWLVRHNRTDLPSSTKWQAKRRNRRKSSRSANNHPNLEPGKDPEGLLLADAVCIFEEFLRTGSRPKDYSWSKVKDYPA